MTTSAKLSPQTVTSAIRVIRMLLDGGCLNGKSLPRQTDFLAGHVGFNLIDLPSAYTLFTFTCYDEQSGKKSYTAFHNVPFAIIAETVEKVLNPFRLHGVDGLSGNLFGRDFSEDDVKVLWKLCCHRFALIAKDHKHDLVSSLKETKFPVPIMIFSEGWMFL